MTRAAAAGAAPPERTAPALSVLVADDEPLARRRLMGLLRRRPEVAAIAEAGDGEAALRELRRRRADLVFLDVQMPGLDGLDLARRMGSPPPAVVFVTAFDRYAVEAFAVSAVDYLLKPFDDDRFAQAFARALQRLRGEALPGPWPVETVVVEKAGRRLVLSWAGVDWVRAAANYVEVHARGESFLLRDTLAAVERRLAPTGFRRVHRSVLVNAARVFEVRAAAGGTSQVVLRDGTRLPVSRRYRRQLLGFGAR